MKQKTANDEGNKQRWIEYIHVYAKMAKPLPRSRLKITCTMGFRLLARSLIASSLCLVADRRAVAVVVVVAIVVALLSTISSSLGWRTHIFMPIHVHLFSFVFCDRSHQHMHTHKQSQRHRHIAALCLWKYDDDVSPPRELGASPTTIVWQNH